MNIQTQCCGIILLVVLFQFYRRHRRVELRTGKAFGRIFYLTFCSVALDALSVAAIVHMDKLPKWLVELNCKIFLVSLVGVIFSSLLYICADVYAKTELVYKKRIHFFVFIFLIEEIIVAFSPIYYYYNPNSGVVYTHGPSVLATYLSAFTFIIVNMIIMIHEKKKINPRRREAVFTWMGVWLLAASVQFYWNNILISGFASTIGVMIIYLKLENPEMNLEKKTGFFNQNAFIEFTREAWDKNNNRALLWMYFDRAFHQHLQSDTESLVDLEFGEYLLGLQDATVFKIAEDEIVIVFDDAEQYEEILEDLEERFEKGWGGEKEVYLHPNGLFLSSLDMLLDVKDLFYLFRYVRGSENDYSDNNILLVNDKLLADMYAEKDMVQLIINAIEHDRIDVYYQPIYSTSEKRFTCAEALMRMRDEEDNIIPPGAFIGVAEKNGMIIQLGEIVFKKVCRFIKENGLIRYGLDYIEVNLSVVQCNYKNLAEDLIQIMEDFDINPEYINLEITESASLKGERVLLDNMKCLMNYGVHFALDDFGTGQSNLNYIVDMPVDIVKFDRSMTNAYFENGKAKYVMDAAMQMIRGMHLKIVSEGIETKKQCDTMETLGINYIQGFYFSKPLPADKFIEFLENEVI